MEALGFSQVLLNFNFDIDASRQVEFHQSVNCFVSRIDDVHQSLMSSDFKLITACLVDVRAAENIKALNSCRKRNWTSN